MSQLSGAPAGAASAATVSSASGSYNIGAEGSPTTPTDMSTMFNGLQNMLGSTQEERETNAKALAAGVKDIGGLVSTISETTLLRRMMEAQSRGMGFIDPGAVRGGDPIPRSFGPAASSPIMSQLGFR